MAQLSMLGSLFNMLPTLTTNAALTQPMQQSTPTQPMTYPSVQQPTPQTFPSTNTPRMPSVGTNWTAPSSLADIYSNRNAHQMWQDLGTDRQGFFGNTEGLQNIYNQMSGSDWQNPMQQGQRGFGWDQQQMNDKSHLFRQISHALGYKGNNQMGSGLGSTSTPTTGTGVDYTSGSTVNPGIQTYPQTQSNLSNSRGATYFSPQQNQYVSGGGLTSGY